MKRAGFTQAWLPIALLLPQLMIIAIFFYWPAGWAVQSSFYLEDPFGFGSTFVGVDNYTDLGANTEYVKIAWFTIVFTAIVTFFSLAIALLLAVKADKVIRGARTYRTLLMWVYAVAPPVAGFIAVIMFNQSWGPLTEAFGLYALSGKATSFLAPLLIALFTDLLDSQRLGIFPIVLLFLGGLFLLPLVTQNRVNAGSDAYR